MEFGKKGCLDALKIFLRRKFRLPLCELSRELPERPIQILLQFLMIIPPTSVYRK
jgi:hypothetical protein